MDPKLLDAPKKAMLSGLTILYKELSAMDAGTSCLEEVLDGIFGIRSRDPSAFLKIVQVGDRLTRGKPFLSDGKFIPGITPDVPTHFRSNPVGMFGRTGFEDRTDLIQSTPVVLFQLVYPFAVV
jgi:hypothetical protein